MEEAVGALEIEVVAAAVREEVAADLEIVGEAVAVAAIVDLIVVEEAVALIEEDEEALIEVEEVDTHLEVVAVHPAEEDTEEEVKEETDSSLIKSN